MKETLLDITLTTKQVDLIKSLLKQRIEDLRGSEAKRWSELQERCQEALTWIESQKA